MSAVSIKDALQVDDDFGRLFSLALAAESIVLNAIGTTTDTSVFAQVYASSYARMAEFFPKKLQGFYREMYGAPFNYSMVPMSTPGSWFLVDGQPPERNDIKKVYCQETVCRLY